jgi:hypothetical protein
MHNNFVGWGEVWSRDHLEDIDLEVRILLKQIIKKGVDRINLAQDRGVWWAAVKSVMNIWVS